MTILPDGDPFEPLLQRFLNKNYEPEERFPENPELSKPQNPVTFLDRHLASNYHLKNIIRAPWIPQELGRICEEAIRTFVADGHTFVNNTGYRESHGAHPITNTSTEDVARYHFVRIAYSCDMYASKLLFHPNDPVWSSFVVSRMDIFIPEDLSFNRFGETAIITPKIMESGEESYRVPHETLRTLEEWVIPTVNKLRDMQNIFNYEFYNKEKQAEDLLKKMGCCIHFDWEVPTAKGAPPVPEPPKPQDSPLIKLMFPFLGTTNSKLRKPLSRKKSVSAKAIPKKRVVAPLQRTQGREHQYRINVNHYLQKAWSRAVEKDATFIVFSCGRLERIGIRHRESQTLYLSDLIDPARWNSPGYSQVHLGLVLAATKDRMSMLKHKENTAERPLKRKKELAPAHTSYNGLKDKATRRKRRKLDPDLDINTFNEELARRDLLLFHLNYRFYQSPAPSSFRRMEPSCVRRPFIHESYNFKRKPEYPPQSYISITADSDFFGHGAVGLAYRVTAEIEMDDGSKHQRNLILKMGDGRKAEKIIHEYELYKRLAQEGVTRGIIGVHGLFHDMETDRMVMIMDDAGITLRQRAIEKSLTVTDFDAVDTTEEECKHFIEALEGIHRACILHNDIRIDNLMINDHGEVFIIDFDCAKYYKDRHPNQYNREMGELLYACGYGATTSDEEDEEEEEGDDGNEIGGSGDES